MYVYGWCDFNNSTIKLLKLLNINYCIGQNLDSEVLDSFEIPEEYDDLFVYTRGNAVFPGYLKVSELAKEKFNL